MASTALRRAMLGGRKASNVRFASIRTITFIPGDGIGPQISAPSVPIHWESADVTPVRGPDGKFGIPQTTIDSVNKHTVGLKGPLMTPTGKGHQSLHLALRKFSLHPQFRSRPKPSVDLGENGKDQNPTPSPSQNPDAKPSPEHMHNVYNILQDTLPKLFIQPMNYRIYSDNIVFVNNLLNKTTIGLFKYVQQVALLRTVGHLRFAYVKFNVLNMSQDLQEGRITVRWRIVGLSGFRVMLKFWKFRLWKWQEIMKQQETWYDGVSYFDVGGDGKIYRHIADKVMVDKDEVEDVKISKGPIPAKLAVLASLFPRPSNLGEDLGLQCTCTYEDATTSTLSDLILTSFL